MLVIIGQNSIYCFFYVHVAMHYGLIVKTPSVATAIAWVPWSLCDDSIGK